MSADDDATENDMDPQVQLAAGLAQVWLIDSRTRPPWRWSEQLDPIEAWMASQISSVARIEAHRAARCWTRQLLGLGLEIPGDAVRFVRREGGKPELPAVGSRPAALRFNYSHTDGYVACALARGADVGVDIERVVAMPELADMLQFVLHAQEARTPDLLGRSDDPLDFFFRVWTAKEALLKATGHGLSVGLQQIALRDAGPQALELAIAPAALEPWLGTRIEQGFLALPDSRYAYAAALLQAGARYDVRHIPFQEGSSAPTQEDDACACA